MRLIDAKQNMVCVFFFFCYLFCLNFSLIYVKLLSLVAGELWGEKMKNALSKS